MNATQTRPDFIGIMTSGKETLFYGATAHEIDRGAFAMAGVLRSYAFPVGSVVLTVSMVPEIIQYGTFEKAAQMLGLLGVNAEDSPFDAARVESICRQFDPVAVCGVSGATLDGLAALGHDPAKVFAGRVVWARPDAYGRLAALGGVKARRVASLGPALALECAHGNVLFDARDWTVRAVDGTLRISARHLRAEPLDDFDTGIAGDVVTGGCGCGTKDGTITLA